MHQSFQGFHWGQGVTECPNRMSKQNVLIGIAVAVKDKQYHPAEYVYAYTLSAQWESQLMGGVPILCQQYPDLLHLHRSKFQSQHRRRMRRVPSETCTKTEVSKAR